MPNATIGDDLDQYLADGTAKDTTAAAAIAADAAASAAATTFAATTATVATDLHMVGPTFVQATDGSIKVYQSSDGSTVSVIVPKPASTPLPAPAPVP